MSLITAALNQINRYGYKGMAKLIPVTGKVEDLDNLTITPTLGAAIDLVSYVGSFGPEQINNTTIFADDIKIMAAPDVDWNGTIADGSKIEIDGKVYDIEKSKTKRLKAVIAYVVIQVKG